jgi:hypothetical protein
VVGLPGSGKTHYVERQGKEHGYVAVSDVYQNNWERWTRVVEAVKQGQDIIIDGALFTEPDGMATLSERIRKLPVAVEVEWRFFEADKNACLVNILRDMILKEGREYHGRLRSFFRRAPGYVVPDGATILKVYKPYDHVELPYGKFLVKMKD